MGEAHRAFTSMDNMLKRTTTNSDNKVSKLIDQLKARTDEFTAATNKTMNAINPTETLVARMRAYGTAVSVGVFIGAAVTAGVMAGLASLAAMRAPQLKEAREEAKRLFQKFTGPMAPPPDASDLEERVGDMERKLGETRATLQERVTAVRVLCRNHTIEQTRRWLVGRLKFDLRTGRGHGDDRPPGPRGPRAGAGNARAELGGFTGAHRQRRAEHCKVGGDRGAGRERLQALIT